MQAHRVRQAPDEHLVQQAERDVMLLSAGRFWATELADHGETNGLPSCANGRGEAHRIWLQLALPHAA